MEMNCKIEDGGVKTFALDYMPVVVVVFFFFFNSGTNRAPSVWSYAF